MENVIYDIETKYIVKYLLEKFGFISLSNRVTSEQVDLFINFIKVKSRRTNKFIEEVNFYL